MKIGKILNRRERIEETLAQHLDLLHLDVQDESHGHNVPEGTESHFKVVAVSEAFVGKLRIQRHRVINELMAEEFEQGMHALAIHVYTEEEWRQRFNQAPMSPPCAGGEKSSGSASI